MSEEKVGNPSDHQAQELAQDKSDEQRELESEWSQGGQDVEEAQHDEPGAAT
jgi:hypothetical protein